MNGQSEASIVPELETAVEAMEAAVETVNEAFGVPPEPTPEPTPEPDWKWIAERAEQHQREIAEVSSQISVKESNIADLKDEMKELKATLKTLNTRLLRLAKEGIGEQLEIDFDKTPPIDNAQPASDDAWQKQPVGTLDIPDGLKEKLEAEFRTVGEVCTWCSDDYAAKIKGIGEAAKEKIRVACDKAAGITDETIRAEAERGKAEREKEESNNHVERDPEEVRQFLERVDELLQDAVGRYDYAEDTLSGIRDWVEKNHCYTYEQLVAVDNIENAPKYDDYEEE